MKNSLLSFKINIGLLISSLLTVYSGILLQVKFHMNHTGTLALNEPVIGFGYSEWSAIHKVSIVVFSLFVIIHIYLHWKLYSAIINKRHFAKNRQVLALTIIFMLVVITCFIPWIIDLMGGGNTERMSYNFV